MPQIKVSTCTCALLNVIPVTTCFWLIDAECLNIGGRFCNIAPSYREQVSTARPASANDGELPIQRPPHRGWGERRNGWTHCFLRLYLTRFVGGVDDFGFSPCPPSLHPPARRPVHLVYLSESCLQRRICQDIIWSCTSVKLPHPDTLPIASRSYRFSV